MTTKTQTTTKREKAIEVSTGRRAATDIKNVSDCGHYSDLDIPTAASISNDLRSACRGVTHVTVLPLGHIGTDMTTFYVSQLVDGQPRELTARQFNIVVPILDSLVRITKAHAAEVAAAK